MDSRIVHINLNTKIALQGVHPNKIVIWSIQIIADVKRSVKMNSHLKSGVKVD